MRITNRGFIGVYPTIFFVICLLAFEVKGEPIPTEVQTIIDAVPSEFACDCDDKTCWDRVSEKLTADQYKCMGDALGQINPIASIMNTVAQGLMETELLIQQMSVLQGAGSLCAAVKDVHCLGAPCKAVEMAFSLVTSTYKTLKDMKAGFNITAWLGSIANMLAGLSKLMIALDQLGVFLNKRECAVSLAPNGPKMIGTITKIKASLFKVTRTWKEINSAKKADVAAVVLKCSIRIMAGAYALTRNAFCLGKDLGQIMNTPGMWKDFINEYVEGNPNMLSDSEALGARCGKSVGDDMTFLENRGNNCALRRQWMRNCTTCCSAASNLIPCYSKCVGDLSLKFGGSCDDNLDQRGAQCISEWFAGKPAGRTTLQNLIDHGMYWGDLGCIASICADSRFAWWPSAEMCNRENQVLGRTLDQWCPVTQCPTPKPPIAEMSTSLSPSGPDCQIAGSCLGMTNSPCPVSACIHGAGGNCSPMGINIDDAKAAMELWCNEALVSHAPFNSCTPVNYVPGTCGASQ